jgi:LuxR family maltose regulon positive regulatory protein
MDEGDSDPATFFYYMGLAATRSNRRRRKPMPVLTPEYLGGGMPAFSRHFFAETFSRLKDPSVVVFDNYQEVSHGAQLHDAILEGLTYMPEHKTAVFISRTRPPVPFARMMTNGMLAQLEWEDMRMTAGEAERIANLRGYDAKEARGLHERTDGWAAGLVLLLEGGATGSYEDASLRERDTEEVFDYFAGEVFRKTDEEARAFLMKTSFMPQMTANMAAAVSGTEQAGRILSALSRDNFFTTRQGPPVAMYRYHPLFREFLQEKAGGNLNREEVAEIQKHTAFVLAEKGWLEEAAQLFTKTAQWEELAGLVMGEAQSLLAQGRFGVLDGWLRALPREMVEGNPWLRFFAGAAIFPRDPAASTILFEQAFHGFLENGDAAGAFLSWSGVIEAIIFRSEDHSGLDAWIPRYGALTERFGEVLPEELKDRVTAAMYTALALRMPDHPDFERWQAEALKVIHHSHDIDLKVRLLFNHALYLQDRGYFDEAEAALNSFRGVVKHKDMTPPASLIYRLAEIHQKSFTHRHEQCLLLVDKALELSRNAGVHVLDSLMAGQAAWSCLNHNDVTRLRHYLTLMEKSPSFAQPFCKAFYLFLKAFEALESGKLHIARDYSEQSIALSRRAGYAGNIMFSLLLGAHVAFELGDSAGAQLLIDEVGEHLRRFGKPSMSHRFALLLAMGYFAFGVDDAGAGYACLREALELGKGRGYFRSYIWREKMMAELCIKALEAGIETEYVKALVTKARLIPETAPVHIEEWPWPLNIYTLGRISVLRDDSPLHFVGKAQRKPVEMLKALLALGGRGVHEERISDILWPEADGDAAHSNFTTTLSRLRRLLGSDEAIEFTGGRLSLDARRCWVDAWAFERAMSEAEARGVSEETVESVERALALYRGAFLAGEDEDWTIFLRERLRRRFLQSVLDLGLFREKAGQWKKAVECYQRGLRVDDLAEELYQRLMISYGELGLKG